MTALRDRKSTMRAITSAAIRGKLLVIECHPNRPHEIYIREARARHGYWVPYLAVFHMGAKIADREAREEKARRRRSA